MIYQYNLDNNFGQYETEEERRKREEEITPVKQTIVTDPTTGKQTMKVEGSVEDLSTNNPLTPTVSAPIAPYVPPTVSEPTLVAGPTNVAGPAIPQPQQMPDQTDAETQRLLRQNQMAQSQPTTQQMPNQMEQARPLSRQLEQPLNPNYSIAPQQMQSNMGIKAPTLPLPTPLQNESMAMQPVNTQVSPFMTKLNEYEQIQKDPGKLFQFSESSDVPDWLKNVARKDAAHNIIMANEQQNAQRKAQDMTETDLAKILRERSTGGNWFKAAIFGMLGMQQSAQAEAAKLGIGQYQTVQDQNGKPYMIKMASNGTPLEGYNATTGTQLTPNELITVASNAATQKGTVTHTGKMQDMTTGEVYYERTTPQGIQLVDTNGKRYTGPSNNLRPFGIGSDIRTINQIQVNKLTNEFVAKPSEAAAKALMEAAAKADPGDGSEIARVQQLIKTLPMPSGGTVSTTGAGAGATTNAGAGATTNAGAVTGGSVTNTSAGVGGGAGARRPGESFDAYNQRMAIAKAQSEANIQQKKELNVAELKPPAEQKGKNEAKDIKNQYYANETYSLIKPLADEIRKSTGSGLGTKVDQLAGVIGASTTGAQAIAKLDILGYQLSSNVPRFEGSQSDADVRLYQQAAGDLANSNKPVATRLAALQAITQVLKKYDKEGKNDWTFGEGQSSNTTSSGNKFKRVQ